MAAGGASRRRRLFLAVLLVLVCATVVAVALRQQRDRSDRVAPPTSAQPAAGATNRPTARFDDARRQLDALAVRGWDRSLDFQRSEFGPPWIDDVDVEFDRNGHNTRDDILRRDLKNLVVRPFTCFAQSGTLVDPYTGARPSASFAVRRHRAVSRSTLWWHLRMRVTRAPDPGIRSAA